MGRNSPAQVRGLRGKGALGQPIVAASRMRFLPALAVVILFQAVTCPAAHAQSSGSPGPQWEWWPEYDTYVRLNDSVSLMLEASRTTDGQSFKSAEIGPTLYFTLKPILRRKLDSNDPSKRKYLTFGAGYRYIPAVNNPDENRAELEFTPRYYFPGRFLLSNRNRFDLREIGGSFSWRYRPRLTLERSCRVLAVSFSPYAQGELFYDSRYGIWNKNIWEFGVIFSAGRRLDVKPYYAHSNDSRSSISHVNAAGLTVSLYFRSNKG